MWKRVCGSFFAALALASMMMTGAPSASAYCARSDLECQLEELQDEVADLEREGNRVPAIPKDSVCFTHQECKELRARTREERAQEAARIRAVRRQINREARDDVSWSCASAVGHGTYSGTQEECEDETRERGLSKYVPAAPVSPSPPPTRPPATQALSPTTPAQKVDQATYLWGAGGITIAVLIAIILAVQGRRKPRP